MSSQDSQKPNNKESSKKPNKFKKIFSWSNVSKVVLPSIFLILIILLPLFFEGFKTRHQQINEIIDSPLPPNWFDDLFGGGAPGEDIDPGDDETPDGFMDGFTEGVSDPERLLFRISPADDYLYWRLNVYDQYNMEDWDRNITTFPISGYSVLPAHSDGEFQVTTNITYFGGTFVGNFPGTYHYYYGEEFSNNYQFSPLSEWDEAESTLEEDSYDCKSFNSQFTQQNDNTTLTYPVAYTIQDNDYIRNQSKGYSILDSLISANSELTNRYLQLPTDYNSEAPLTYSIANSLYDNSKTIYQQIVKNMMWLTKNATYDYEMLMGESDEEPAPGEDYVEWFLNRRSGTAAHFAAALAILSRIQGIPTRIVTGFSYGERSGDDFLIKAKHVHSWTEVYIPFNSSIGLWVAFDPSPLIPGLRDQYGENTIGFNFVLQCSNEFFLLPEHMLRQGTYPYFIPNPLSDAWYQDPYDPSVWYGPYVDRLTTFDIYGFLGEGTDEDLFQFLLTGELGDLIPIAGEEITFYDRTADLILGTAYTNTTGIATLEYNYSSSADIGEHLIDADWYGLTSPTYDTRYLPTSYVEAGVIIRSSINLTSMEFFDYTIPHELNIDLSGLNYLQSIEHVDFYISICVIKKTINYYLK
ncbi:MAG: transglutaminase-like domain-containing protein [Asgard group archaeon]|nr:transglutaminase-like domain-containing protein [Asgard group archaeon]